MIRPLAAALGAAGLLLLGATPAFADPGASQLCSTHDDFGTSHGACTSFFENGNLTAAIANACKDPAVQAFVGDDNVGQCVKDLKALVG